MAVIVPFDLSQQASIISKIVCLYDPLPAYQFTVSATGDYIITPPDKLIRDTTVASAGFPASNYSPTVPASAVVAIPLPQKAYTFNPPSLVYGQGSVDDHSVVLVNTALARIEPGFFRIRIDYIDLNSISHTEYFDCPFYETWDVTARELNQIVNYIEARSSFLQKEIDQLTAEMSWALSREFLRGTMVSGEVQVARATTGLMDGPLTSSQIKAVDEKAVCSVGMSAGPCPDDFLSFNFANVQGNGNHVTHGYDDSGNGTGWKGSLTLTENTDGTLTFWMYDSNWNDTNVYACAWAFNFSSNLGDSRGDSIVFTGYPLNSGNLIRTSQNYSNGSPSNGYSRTADPNGVYYYFDTCTHDGTSTGILCANLNGGQQITPSATGDGGPSVVDASGNQVTDADVVIVNGYPVVRWRLYPTAGPGTQISITDINHAVASGNSSLKGTYDSGAGPSLVLQGPSTQISSITPSTVCAGGTITINGIFESSSYSVYVNSTSYPCTIQSQSSSTIVATLPANVPLGIQNVIVAPQSGSSASKSIQINGQPTISSVYNTSTGDYNVGCYGDTIQINGSGFGSSQGSGYAVEFESSSNVSAPVVSWSDSAIVVQAPSGLVPGNWNLVVTSPCGYGSASFTVPAPAITAAAPACPGLDFLVEGTYLTPNATVYLSTSSTSPVTACITSAAATRYNGSTWQMKVHVPASFALGPGNYDLSVHYNTYSVPTAFYQYTIPSSCAPNGGNTCTISANANTICTTDSDPLHVVFNGVDVSSSASYFVDDNNGNPVYGVVSSNGVFSCPTPGSYTVYANYQGAYTNTVTIVVNNCNPDTLQLTAATYQTCAGTDVQLNAKIPQTSTDVTTQAVYSGPTGSVNAAGVFNEALPGTYTFYATYNDNGTEIQSNSITIIVQDCTPQSLVLSPAQTNLVAAQTQQFHAYFVRQGQANVDVTGDCTWYVNNNVNGDSSDGSISNGGSYAAPQVISSNFAVDVMAKYTAPNGDVVTAHATVNLAQSGGPQATVTVTSQVNVFLGDGRSGFVPVGQQIQAYPGDYVYVQFAETLDYPNRLPIASNTDTQQLTMYAHSAVASDVASVIYNTNSTVNPDLTIATYRTVVLGVIDPSDGRFHSMWDIAEAIPGDASSGQHSLPSLAKDAMPNPVSLLTNIAGVKGLGDTNWAKIGNVIIAWGEATFLGVAKGRTEKKHIVYPQEFVSSCTVMTTVKGKGKYISTAGRPGLKECDLYAANLDANKADIIVQWLVVGV